MAELVDAQDLKSCVKQLTCQFDSGSRQIGLLVLQGGFFFIYTVFGVFLWNFILILLPVHFLQLKILKTSILLLWDLD